MQRRDAAGEVGHLHQAEAGLGDQGVESYTNWNTDEPNDASDSDCLRILTTGLWADWQCGSVKGYVCQQTAP